MLKHKELIKIKSNLITHNKAWLIKIKPNIVNRDLVLN